MPGNKNPEFNTTILMPWTDGLYVVAKPNYEGPQLGPTKDYVLPEEVVPFGFQKNLNYVHYKTEAGFLRKSLLAQELRRLCFNDMLSELESMVSARGADAVLVEITGDRLEDYKWLLGGHAQLLMYRNK